MINTLHVCMYDVVCTEIRNKVKIEIEHTQAYTKHVVFWCDN